MLEVRRDYDPRADVLYLSYDGVLEPLGRSQVISYVEGLAKDGLRLSLISFEKPENLSNRAEMERLRSELEELGVFWKPLRYHRRPRALATAWDVVRGATVGLRAARRWQPDCLHARSYVAGLMALAIRFGTGARFVFDMRGFWPEERVELGLFRQNGFWYRASKLAERSLLGAADHVVVLTDKAKALLREHEAKARLAYRLSRESPITVVPCCVDLDRFTPSPIDRELARRHGLEKKIVIGNVGAFNRRYMTPEMFRFAFHLREHRPEVRFVYLTEGPPGAIARAARDAGLRDEDLLVVSAEPAEVPRWLSLFRLGIFFLRPSYAAKASSFTKLGEFLACGVPVVTNTGVGDVEAILGSERCGFLLPGLTDRELGAFAKKTLPLLEGDEVPMDTRLQCRRTAVEHFSLAEGVRRYRTIYDSLVSSRSRVDEGRVPAEV
jgi:glycosyltransferase involved in cell wall biosynthesis